MASLLLSATELIRPFNDPARSRSRQYDIGPRSRYRDQTRGCRPASPFEEIVKSELEILRAENLHGLDLLHALDIDLRQEGLLECQLGLNVLVLALVPADAWQQAFGQILEGRFVFSVGYAESIVCTLDIQTVRVGFFPGLQRSVRAFQSLGVEMVPGIVRALDRGQRHLRPELNHEEAGKLIRGVFFAAEPRNAQNVEDRVPQFVQGHLNTGAENDFRAGESRDQSQRREGERFA